MATLACMANDLFGASLTSGADHHRIMRATTNICAAILKEIEVQEAPLMVAAKGGLAGQQDLC
jgi:hypothetical protein